ncbi:bifunctional coenzyme A synthase-like [Limulus polyphemus]|uniref:Bifunctional coenzyme A synthase-like n=1 Tax=Limulus polyphemus TaxID=6850 RepID=A0ABM1BBF7_LIMPO|nr:bifunctional coenzyme A synthase-like [Limulus polyphemus]
MFGTGLMVLTAPSLRLLSRVPSYLKVASELVSKTLYIKLEPGKNQLWPLNHSFCNLGELSAVGKLIPAIYKQASHSCANLDVRVLQGFTKKIKIQDHGLINSFDVVITDSPKAVEGLIDYVKYQYNKECGTVHVLENKVEENQKHASTIGNLSSVVVGVDTDVDKQNSYISYSSCCQVYKKVVIGGTFDRLHNGHKVLLSQAALVCSDELIVGITDGEMIQKKKLWELIEPVEKRMSDLRNFLQEIDPTLSYRIVPIYDPFGPSTEDPLIECIVTSEETLQGGKKVNEERMTKGMSPLKLHMVSMVHDPSHNSIEEDKVSSSSIRMRLLGTELNPPTPKPHLPSRPYLIGLTGSIASGKSSISKRLEKLGAAVINSDKLAHRSYEHGREAYRNIVFEFGEEILNPDKSINRKLLAAKVFENEDKRSRLNEIVWPEVAKLIEEEIHKHAIQGAEVIVLEVVLLFEAGWKDKFHQVWVTIIPEEEAIRRVEERDKLPKEQIIQRIRSQISNKERVAGSNIVFSTLWEPEYTQLQVEKAWNTLQRHLKEQI